MKHSTHVDLIIAWILVVLSFFHEVRRLTGSRFNYKIVDQQLLLLNHYFWMVKTWQFHKISTIENLHYKKKSCSYNILSNMYNNDQSSAIKLNNVRT